jgi:hypothetical protein
LDIATIISIDPSIEHCVGDQLEFTLSGVGPFTISKYNEKPDCKRGKIERGRVWFKQGLDEKYRILFVQRNVIGDY